MTRHPFIALLALLSACPGTSDVNPDRVPRAVTSREGDLGAVVDGHNAFSFALYRELVSDPTSGNLFYSPFSVTSALGMTRAGARGTTLTEMSDVLGGAPLEEATWHNELGALTRDLSGDQDRGYTLHIANRLFGQTGYPWETEFLGICADDYGAPLESWDFVADPEGGRERVNTWVADQTEDKIQDLLPEGSVTDATRLVLANAIYFLGDWAFPFDEDDTRDRTFTRLDGSTVDVPTMHLQSENYDEPTFEVAFGDDVAVVRLPYQDDELSMVLIVPNAVNGLPAVEASLDAEQYASWVADLGPGELVLSMPKIEMRTAVDLKGPLSNLGMPTAFDSSAADFTGMAVVPEDGVLHIDGVYHQAFVKVDEHGTEAAAATGVVVGVDSAPIEVAADRPFLFVIQDDLTGAILFVGRVLDPS